MGRSRRSDRTPVLPSAIATRRRLVEAGRIAFAKKGYDGVSLQADVLEPADVSVGSFYHQFSDKAELLAEVLANATARAQTALDARRASADRPADAAESFAMLFDIADAAEDLIRIQLRERDNPNPRIRESIVSSRRLWLQYLQVEFQRYESPQSDFSAATAARMVSALGLGALIHYLDMPLAERAEIRQTLIDGLAAFTVGGFAAMGAASHPHF